MRFSNPTTLQVGMSGTLLGTTYRVAGRVVMGVEEEGETYFWNEFDLVAAEGTSATLVYEETAGGGQWRLFTLFEPECELTAEDAATKQVGDPLNLDGTDVRVTLVDESRVYHIEGAAPEGVEVGDIARYFNAEAGDTMVVVSWTQNEVECYHGEDLSVDTVNSAFNLRSAAASSYRGFLPGQRAGSPSSGLSWLVLGLLALVIAVIGYASCFSKRPAPGPRRTSAPAAMLSIGSSGTLDGRRFRVQSQAMVEVARVGTLCEQLEYELTDPNGDERALLVGGFTPGKNDWCLWTPIPLQKPPSPAQAAKVQTGQRVQLEEEGVVVSELFQVTVQRVEPPATTHPAPGDVLYGFAAQSGSTPFMARWNDQGITCFRGKKLSAAEVKSAFRP